MNSNVANGKKVHAALDVGYRRLLQRQWQAHILRPVGDHLLIELQRLPIARIGLICVGAVLIKPHCERNGDYIIYAIGMRSFDNVRWRRIVKIVTTFDLH